MADHINKAKLIELPGIDLVYSTDGGETIVDHIEQFVTGRRQAPQQPERLLATVLFVDIVNSTEHAAKLGDNPWRELLEKFYAKMRAVLQQYRGREINTSGDGFLATFDGPARAVRCAGAIRDEVRSLGLEVRCGLHTGECEIVGDDLAGIAVIISVPGSLPLPILGKSWFPRRCVTWWQDRGLCWRPKGRTCSKAYQVNGTYSARLPHNKHLRCLTWAKELLGKAR